VKSNVPKLAERFLGDDFEDLLVEQWAGFHISVRDEHVLIGPFLGNPEQSADVVSKLVDSMQNANEDSGDEVAEDLDAFCFYCGHLVRSDVEECPACGGDLSDD